VIKAALDRQRPDELQSPNVDEPELGVDKPQLAGLVHHPLGEREDHRLAIRRALRRHHLAVAVRERPVATRDRIEVDDLPL